MNLAKTLHYAAERAPEAEAVVDGVVRLSYADLRRRAAALAGGLAAQGLRPGDSLAVVLKNRHQTVELYWAAQWLGVRFVPLSWRTPPAGVAYCVEDAGARLVFHEEASADHAAVSSPDAGANHFCFVAETRA